MVMMRTIAPKAAWSSGPELPLTWFQPSPPGDRGQGTDIPGGGGRGAGDRETGGGRREVGEETRTGREVGRPALSAPRSSKAICPSPSRGTHVMTSVSSPGSLSSPSTNTEVLVKLCVLQVRPSSTLNLQRAGNHHRRQAGA